MGRPPRPDDAPPGCAFVWRGGERDVGGPWHPDPPPASGEVQLRAVDGTGRTAHSAALDPSRWEIALPPPLGKASGRSDASAPPTRKRGRRDSPTAAAGAPQVSAQGAMPGHVLPVADSPPGSPRQPPPAPKPSWTIQGAPSPVGPPVPGGMLPSPAITQTMVMVEQESGIVPSDFSVLTTTQYWQVIAIMEAQPALAA
eukprot:gene24426-12855_t